MPQKAAFLFSIGEKSGLGHERRFSQGRASFLNSARKDGETLPLHVVPGRCPSPRRSTPGLGSPRQLAVDVQPVDIGRGVERIDCGSEEVEEATGTELPLSGSALGDRAATWPAAELQGRLQPADNLDRTSFAGR